MLHIRRGLPPHTLPPAGQHKATGLAHEDQHNMLTTTILAVASYQHRIRPARPVAPMNPNGKRRKTEAHSSRELSSPDSSLEDIPAATIKVDGADDKEIIQVFSDGGYDIGATCQSSVAARLAQLGCAVLASMGPHLQRNYHLDCAKERSFAELDLGHGEQSVRNSLLHPYAQGKQRHERPLQS
ncbi:hypothetical protein NX059_012458 [Plenodomus lindquistii]|nr:hypothetical protein NX059_012458 [Plenodomus lindquistii]